MKHLFNICIVMLVLTLFAWILFAGCSESDDSDSDSSGSMDDDDDDDQTSDDDDIGDDDDLTSPGCGKHLVTRGFGLGWKRLNHRISLWEIYPQQPDCPSVLPEDSSLHIGYIGGDFSTGDIMKDIPLYDYWGSFVTAENLVSFQSAFTEMVVAADDYEQWVEVSLSGDQYDSDTTVVVFVTGLAISTDIEQADPDYPDSYDPAMGYTVKEIGAGIESIAPKEGNVSFTVWGKFKPGPADRTAMNEAIEHAQVAMTVYYTAIALHNAASTAFEQQYLLTYPPPHFPIPQQIDHATAEQRQVEVAGKSGYGIAFPGFTQFDFKLFGDTVRGDYIREISLASTLLSLDSETGTALLDVDGYASNSSLIAYETMETDFSASLALIQLPAGIASPVYSEGAFETGQTEIDF